jgi:hypothetical protein
MAEFIRDLKCTSMRDNLLSSIFGILEETVTGLNTVPKVFSDKREDANETPHKTPQWIPLHMQSVQVKPLSQVTASLRSISFVNQYQTRLHDL